MTASESDLLRHWGGRSHSWFGSVCLFEALTGSSRLRSVCSIPVIRNQGSMVRFPANISPNRTPAFGQVRSLWVVRSMLPFSELRSQYRPCSVCTSRVGLGELLCDKEAAEVVDSFKQLKPFTCNQFHCPLRCCADAVVADTNALVI
jgi:hypothetical protein